MRNPFARLATRDTARPSLRERAASLKASASRVIRRETKGTLPEPNSEEARALFHAACMETDRLSRAAIHGYPELKRDAFTSWIRATLQKALEAGEIAPADMAPLYRLAAEREHRIDAAVVATGIGTLHFLAFADDFSRAAAVPVAEHDADPILAAIAETHRLITEANCASDLAVPAGTTTPLPEQNAAHAAFRAHVDDVLLKTVPTRQARCRTQGRDNPTDCGA